MKRTIKSLDGFVLNATDGEIGKVKDFYFDDTTWTIKYLVVETGNWLSGRSVLISPQMLLTPDWEGASFPVKLTKQQVKASPDIDSEKPVSRQEEDRLNHYYALEYYREGSLWQGGIGTSGMMMPGFAPFEEEIAKANMDGSVASAGDAHLRSTGKVTGYTVTAADGEAGKVGDFIIEAASWKIDFIVADTGKWLSGEKVLINTGAVKEIRWATSEIIVTASVEDVKVGPAYDPGQFIDEGKR